MINIDEIRNDIKKQLEIGTNNAYGFIELVALENPDFLTNPSSYDELASYGIKLELVHAEGDCEGGGDYSERVYSIRASGELAQFNDLLVRIVGSYGSYTGTDWDADSWAFVKAVKVTKDEYVMREAYDNHRANPKKLNVLAVDADKIKDMSAEQKQQLLTSLTHFMSLLQANP